MNILSALDCSKLDLNKAFRLLSLSSLSEDGKKIEGKDDD
jgi:hypothetical protein